MGRIAWRGTLIGAGVAAGVVGADGRKRCTPGTVIDILRRGDSSLAPGTRAPYTKGCDNP